MLSSRASAPARRRGRGRGRGRRRGRTAAAGRRRAAEEGLVAVVTALVALPAAAGSALGALLLLQGAPSAAALALASVPAARRGAWGAACLGESPGRPPPGRLFSAAASQSAEPDEDEDDEEEEPAEPGRMRVSEIKAELELRGIGYGDCFDRESLAGRLEAARAAGRADPAVLERFNKQRLEQALSEERAEVRDEDIGRAAANDGTLPGGMTPEAFKTLSGSPEVMELLSSTKMQEAMALVMTEGRDGLERKLRDDPELQETVRKLDEALRAAQQQ